MSTLPSKKQEKYNRLYMDIALRMAEMSYATRLKVGAIVVKNGNIIAAAWNGMPPGFDNCCETDASGESITRREVLHAEQNVFIKLAKSTESAVGASLYITHSPCIECAKILAEIGLKDVYYINLYRDRAGLEHLRQRGVEVHRIFEE